MFVLRSFFVTACVPLIFATACGDDGGGDEAAATEGLDDGGSSGDDGGPSGGSSDDTNGSTTDPTGVDSSGDGSDSSGGPPSGPWPSPGCGSQPGDITNLMMDVDGRNREFNLLLPEPYDPDNAYALVWVWHGVNGNGMNEANAANIINHWEGEAIGIYPTGTVVPSVGTTAWIFDPAGIDFAFFDQLYDKAAEQLCFDQNRVFTQGFSAGGFMSNYVACFRGDMIRGNAPVAGGGPNSGCDTPVAAFVVHGNNDTTVPLSQGTAMRDRFAALAGCGSETVAVEPDPCVAYQGCDEAYPVVYCEYNGGHGFQGWASPAAADLFAPLPYE